MSCDVVLVLCHVQPPLQKRGIHCWHMHLISQHSGSLHIIVHIRVIAIVLHPISLVKCLLDSTQILVAIQYLNIIYRLEVSFAGH